MRTPAAARDSVISVKPAKKDHPAISRGIIETTVALGYFEGDETTKSSGGYRCSIPTLLSF